MNWLIEGTSDNLSIEINEEGRESVGGINVAHSVSCSGGDRNAEFYSRLNSAECVFSILRTDETELATDPNGTGFFKLVQSAREKIWASICLYTEPDVVEFRIMLPPQVHTKVHHLATQVLANTHLRLGVSVGFRGFRVPSAKTDTPTISEFAESSSPTKGRIYVTNEVNFRVRHVENA
jgi:hypothetical protein